MKITCDFHEVLYIIKSNEIVPKQKLLMNSTMGMHVHHKTLYISLLFTAKQRREITKLCVCFEIFLIGIELSFCIQLFRQRLSHKI